MEVWKTGCMETTQLRDSASSAERHVFCFYASILLCLYSSKFPAKYPVENAACKLNPPVGPSISKISPQK